MIKLYLKEDPAFRTYTFLTPAYIVISPLRALLVQKTDMLSCLATRRSLANLVLSISIPQTIYQSIKQIRYEGNLTPCISLYALSRILVFAKYFKGEKRFLVVNKDIIIFIFSQCHFLLQVWLAQELLNTTKPEGKQGELNCWHTGKKS